MTRELTDANIIPTEKPQIGEFISDIDIHVLMKAVKLQGDAIVEVVNLYGTKKLNKTEQLMANYILILQGDAMDFLMDLIETTYLNQKEAMKKMKKAIKHEHKVFWELVQLKEEALEKMKKALNDEQKAFEELVQLKGQQNVKNALKLQDKAKNFTYKAIKNMTRAAEKTQIGEFISDVDVLMKAVKLQGDALEAVKLLNGTKILNKTEQQMANDILMLQGEAMNFFMDLIETTYLYQKVAVTKMKKALNDEKKAFYELWQLIKGMIEQQKAEKSQQNAKERDIKEDKPVNRSRLVPALSVDSLSSDVHDEQHPDHEKVLKKFSNKGH